MSEEVGGQLLVIVPEFTAHEAQAALHPRLGREAPLGAHLESKGGRRVR